MNILRWVYFEPNIYKILHTSSLLGNHHKVSVFDRLRDMQACTPERGMMYLEDIFSNVVLLHKKMYTVGHLSTKGEHSFVDECTNIWSALTSLLFMSGVVYPWAHFVLQHARKDTDIDQAFLSLELLIQFSNKISRMHHCNYLWWKSYNVHMVDIIQQY